MSWTRETLFTIIGIVILAAFVVIWGFALYQTWTYDGDVRQTLDPLLVLLAGAIATAIGTQTAAALGFAASDIRQRNNIVQTQATPITSAVTNIPKVLFVGVLVYLAVGVVVLITALVDSATAPELVQAFALSVFGWLLGAGTVAFATGSSAPNPPSPPPPTP